MTFGPPFLLSRAGAVRNPRLNRTGRHLFQSAGIRRPSTRKKRPKQSMHHTAPALPRSLTRAASALRAAMTIPGPFEHRQPQAATPPPRNLPIHRRTSRFRHPSPLRKRLHKRTRSLPRRIAAAQPHPTRDGLRDKKTHPAFDAGCALSTESAERTTYRPPYLIITARLASLKP